MDLKNLRCFVAVAEKLNFSRAAESIYLSQPALSLRINALEDELGTPLFLRTRQQVYLTAAGSALLPEVQDILAKLDALPDIAKNSEEALELKTGKISILLDDSMPEDMMNTLMAMFAKFYELYPEISVSIDSVDFSEYEIMLFSRKADLCFIGLGENEPINPGFSSIALKSEPMVLAFEGEECRSNYELLSSRELLLLEGEERWNMVLLNYLAARQIKPKVRSIRGGPALCVNLMRPKTMTFMPKAFFDCLAVPNLAYRYLNIPGDQVLSTLVWDKHNYNPALQLMVNCCEESVQP